MRFAAVAGVAAFVIGGCASDPSTRESASAVRTRAPVNYENTIANYFDFHIVDDPAQRKLVFAPPEASRCALFGGGGAHQGYVVPVIYDTTFRPKPVNAPEVTPAVPAGTVAAAAAKNTKGAKSPKKPAAGSSAVATSGTAAESPPALGSTMTLKDVSITGNRYYFWFSNETIGAVTKRMDLCP